MSKRATSAATAAAARFAVRPAKAATWSPDVNLNEKEGPWYWGNQTITRERLAAF